MAQSGFDTQYNARKIREINGAILLAAAVFLAVAYYIPSARTGVLGNVFLGFGKGILGVSAFALPVVLLFMAFDYFMEKSAGRTAHRIRHILILLLLTATFIHIFQFTYEEIRLLSLNDKGDCSAWKSITILWNINVHPRQFIDYQGRVGGGVLGGLLALGLQRLTGHTGAVILLVLATIVELILLLDLSVSELFQRAADLITDFIDRTKQKKAERQALIEEQNSRCAEEEDALRRARAAYSAGAEGAAPVDDAWTVNNPGAAFTDDMAENNREKNTEPFFSTHSESLGAKADVIPAATQLFQDDSLPPFSPDNTEQDFSGRTARNIPDGEGGFINVLDVDEQGAVRTSPEAMGLLEKYPEWDAKAAFNQPEAAGFATIPISSYDAQQSGQPLDLMGEKTAGDSSAQNSEPFPVPNFLKNESASRNRAENMESELQQVLWESMEADPEEDVRVDPPLAGQHGANVIRPVDGILAPGENMKPNADAKLMPEAAGLMAREMAEHGARTPHSAGTSDYGKSSVHSNDDERRTRQTVTSADELDADVKVYKPVNQTKPYKLPPTTLLRPADTGNARRRAHEVQGMGRRLEETIRSFGVDAKVINITTGPAITRFELAPGPGVKVARIVSLTDDIALSLAAVGVRIEAPIPGKSAIGIEIPNKETVMVGLRALLESPDFKNAKPLLTVALGRDISGAPILCDLSKMPHLLIAGATGSGKSVCINVILLNILYRAKPDEVKLLMIDPKVVELSVYNGIPHLLAPVVTDPKKASNTLNWAVLEMTRRYGLLAEHGVRDFKSYNEVATQKGFEKLPLIVIVIDELADLMMVAANEVEDSISRLTALARAAGIHLIIATQRPSVDVITGVIKANIPSRIAFAVSSQVDSRTIIDMGGAEKLLGKGDMLYFPQILPKAKRGQGAFVSDHEVEAVVSFAAAQNYAGYDEAAAAEIVAAAAPEKTEAKDTGGDELFDDAVGIILEAGYASVSILQRRMNIGYPRAGRLIDSMEQAGIIGPSEGSKPRKVLIDRMQWEARRARDNED